MTATPYVDAAVSAAASTHLRGGETHAEVLIAAHETLMRVISHAEDADLFGCRQRVVSPDETLRLGCGDCEDYAFCVYTVASRLGVPEDGMRLMHCLVDGWQQHCVLLWSADGQDLVIDNQAINARPLSRRPDLSQLRELDIACFPRRAGEVVPPLRYA